MTPDRNAICLATLRCDGFVALAGDGQGGTVTTKPFRHDGARLYLNAIARPGAITCELLDAAGQPLPGFEQADCQPITGDGVRLAVQWPGQARLPTGTLRLRCQIHDAQLFSYWVE
jgi:hypothetical protein